MNKRTKELFERCGGHYEALTPAGYITYCDHLDIERFARLIALDCLTICEEYGDRGFNGHYCADAIKSVYMDTETA